VALWRRWRVSLITGVAVWALSFPLLLPHPVAGSNQPSASTPVAAGFVVPAVDTGLKPRLRPVSAPRLTIGQLAAAPTPAAASTGHPLAGALAVGRNRIVIPRLDLSQPVGWYSDCLGRAAVPRWGAWRWSCAGSNNTYILAHNPGVFSPILNLRIGDLVEYGDPAGRVHTYRVTLTTIVNNTQLWPLSSTPVASLTLQTCWTWDGSRDFIVRAVQI
jgi:hypothetical protein